MPAKSKAGKAEAAMMSAAHKKGMKGKRADHYVYGGLNNMGLMRGNKVSAKGKQKARTALS